MKFNLTSLLFLALATTSLAQEIQCGSTSQELTYNLCRERVEQFKSSTCDPMFNSTMQAFCVCYYQRDLLNCFSQCTDAGPTAERASLSASASASCSVQSQGVFPNGLPVIAPWRTDFGPPAVPAPTNTKTVTTPTETVGSSGTDKDSGSGKIAAGTLLIITTILF